MAERAVNRFLIDTNIFLEVIFAQDRKEEAFVFLQEVTKGEFEALATSLSLHTIEIMAVRDKLFEELKEFLNTVSKMQGLSIHQTSIEEEISAVDTARKYKLDYEDALQYIVAKRNKLTLVSFDRDFDKTDLKRTEPVNLRQDPYGKG